MRLLGRLLTLILVLLLLWPLAETYLAAPLARLMAPAQTQRADLPEEAEQSTVFWLEQARWLRFSVTENNATLRILSHLQMLPEQNQEDALVRYGLDYRLRDRKGQVVSSGRYHYKATVLPPRTLDDGRVLPARFYDNPEPVASAAENLFLDLAKTPNAVTLELRAAHQPDRRNRIGVQVSARELRSREIVDRLWPRLKPETRTRLLRPHAYPPHLVSPFEIENALTDRWVPMGPEGIDGEDFSSGYLYTLEIPPPPPRAASEALPPGLYADHHKWLTLPLAFAGDYRLEVQPVAPSVGPFTVNLAHQGNDDLNVEQRLIDGQAPRLSWSGRLNPGLLQVIPSVPVTVRLFDEATGAELTPDKNYLQADRVVPEQPVRFRLNPRSTGSQPVRMDFRTYSHPQLPDSGPEPRVEIVIRGADGQVLQEAWQPVNPPPSHYQRFSGDLPESRVSDGQSLFFQAPAEAAELEVSSSTPVLVTGYARLSGLPLSRELPDERRPWQDYQERTPSWFLMRPIAAPNPSLRQVSLQWFFQPIERSAAIVSGRYDWQALEPAAPSLERVVLFPHQLTGPLRDTAVGSVYRALPRDRVSLALEAPSPGIPFTPELIYRRPATAPETVTVYKDGEVWLRRGIAGRTGRFSLPMVEAGRYAIAIDGSGQWYLNHNRPPAGTGYLQRSSHSLDRSGLDFVLDKTAAREVVNLDLIAPPGTDNYVVNVRIKPARRSSGALSDYSFLERRLELRPGTRETLVLGASSEPRATPIGAGIPLGADLPSGRYLISVQPEQPGGLVAAYTVREGQRQTYRFFRRSLDGY